MNTAKKAPRRQERVLAFKVLYTLCFTPVTSIEDLRETFEASPDKVDSPDGNPVSFAWELVRGVWIEQSTVDEAITGYSQNWRIERMAKVELTLLRLALFELMFRPDIPARAVVNEAIELSKQFGDDKSRGFVNGILDAALKAIDSGELVRTTATAKNKVGA